MKKHKERRPFWVWVICLFYVLSIFWSFLSLYLIKTGALHLKAAKQAYFDSFTFIDYGLGIVLSIITLIGAVALFLMRKFALDLFLIVFIINLPYSVWSNLTTGRFLTFSIQESISFILGYVLQIVIIAYVLRLAKRRILR